MKILIFGPPGSGKTTFANQLSLQLKIPVFHVDKHFFEKGWKERQQEDFLADVQVVLNKEDWIIDGNAMRTLEMRFQEADIALYCCPPRSLCLYRVFKRFLKTLGQEKKDGPEGSKNNITLRLLKYLWQFRKRYDTKIFELHKRYPQVQFHQLKSPLEMEEIFDHFSQKQ